MIAKKKLFISVLIIITATILLFFLALISKPEKDNKPVFLYTVQPNDTCGKIAVALGVSVISIIEANDLEKDCNDIYAGKVLSIPYPTTAPRGKPGPTYVGSVVDCERDTYLVKDGDTLTSIAMKYKVPEEAVSFFNGLTNDKIYTGMALAIPLCYITPTPVSSQ